MNYHKFMDRVDIQYSASDGAGNSHSISMIDTICFEREIELKQAREQRKQVREQSKKIRNSNPGGLSPYFISHPEPLSETDLK